MNNREQPDSGNQFEDEAPAEKEKRERSPKFVASMRGRMVSTRGLVERVIEEYRMEHGQDDSPDSIDALTPVERRKLVRNVVEYVIGVESVHLDRSDHARLIAHAYGELFGFGPLNEWLENDEITTILVEGANKLSVRRGPGASFEEQEPIFEDTPHLIGVIRKLLRQAGAELRDDEPLIETGLLVEGRRVCLNVAVPPTVPEYSVDIRVHPAQAPTLPDLVESGMLDETARTLIEALVQSPHGILISGETEAGKTTLLNALVWQLPATTQVISVERAGELSLPETAQQYVTRWPINDAEGITFGQQISRALAQATSEMVFILDEVRADEPAMILPLLEMEAAPRQFWSFRGSADPKRLRSSLGMLARMAGPHQPEAMVYALQARLPFVISLRRRQERLELRAIAEWQFSDADVPPERQYGEYTPLLTFRDGISERTGQVAQRPLDLPAAFWDETDA